MIPTGVGILVIPIQFIYNFQFLGGLHLSHRLSEQQPAPIMPASPLHKLYTLLPLTAITKTWGALTSTTIPELLRAPIYSFYSSIFACNLTEMLNPLVSYPNLGEFFYRELKKGARIIDGNASIVSPADGLLTHFGVCEGDRIEQVKGLTYSLQHLLDGQVQDYTTYDASSSGNSSTSRYKFNKNDETDLYYAVIYLGPGDYHRFHSPLNWSLERIKSFSGELYSVNPVVVKWLRGVFALNSRVVYEGSWKDGYMAMVAVGKL
jgi:phosphatidylserine decarboxylase